ncbi:MAG: tetratricopeptide repeat protein [Planctomycetes bacterium]|nr:tetratricopeptide repeat protein [Planctomycetota bacterium]
MGQAKYFLLALFSLSTWIVVSTLAVAQDSPEDAFSALDPRATAAFKAGAEQMEQENWKEAITAFSEAISIDDSFSQAYLGRADALRELEDYRSALSNYSQALNFLQASLNPITAHAYNGRGVCHRELENTDLAASDFYNAIEIDRNNPEIAANYGDILVNYGGDPASALDYLDTAIDLDPENAEAYRNRGLARAQLREFEESIEDLEKSVELDPSEYLTYSTLAGIHTVEEEFEKAIEAFNQAIEHYQPEKSSDPDLFIEGYLRRGEAQLRLAFDEETSAEQRETLYNDLIVGTDHVLTEFPEAGMALHQRGQAMRLQGRLNQAIKAFTDAIQLAGGEASYLADAYLKRGICWHYQGQDSLARGDFEQSAGIRFEDPLPHFWIGLSHAQEASYREAIDSYGEAIAKAPTFPAPYINRGLAYMQLGGFQKAVDNFNEAIRNEPAEPEHFFKRGIAHMRMEEYQKAFDSFHLATLNDEKMAKAFRGAAGALKALDRTSLAEQYADRARAIDAEGI